MMAAATAISRARCGSAARTALRGLDEDPVRVGGRAEVDLDVTAQACDVAEQQQGRSAASRAVPAAPAPRPAWPHAQALRAAANVQRRRAGPGRRSAPPRVRRPPARRRTRRVARARDADAAPGRRRRRVRALGGGGAVPGLAVGIAATGQAPPPAPGAPAAAARRWRPGRSPSGPAGAARDTDVVVVDEQPGGHGGLQRLLVQARASAAAARRRRASPVSSARPRAAASTAPSAGSCRLRSRKTCSTRAVRCSCAGSGDRHRRAGRALSSVGSSSSASGLPPVSAMSRSVTSSAPVRRPGARPSSARAASGSSPVSGQLGEGRRRRTCRSAPSRAAKTSSDPVGTEPAGAEQQRVGRGGVEPVRVVDDAQHQVLLGRGGEHRQRRDRHQERLDRRARPPRRTPPAAPGPAGPGSSLAQSRQRAQQPVQRGERQRRLDLEPLGAQHRSRRRRAGHELVEQRRLADTGLAADDQAAGRPRGGPPRRGRPGRAALARGPPARGERTTAPRTPHGRPNPAL